MTDTTTLATRKHSEDFPALIPSSSQPKPQSTSAEQRPQMRWSSIAASPKMVPLDTPHTSEIHTKQATNTITALFDQKCNIKQGKPEEKTLAEQVLLKDNQSPRRKQEEQATVHDTQSAPPRLLSKISEDTEEGKPSDGTLTMKSRKLLALLRQRSQEVSAEEREANRSRAVKALNSNTGKGSLKQLRRERAEKHQKSTIELMTKMTPEEVNKNYPPGIYRVERSVMLRRTLSIDSTPVCTLKKDQLLTVAEVVAHVHAGKRTVRAKITSPYSGWTSLISTNMRRCLTLECKNDSPELLELAERSRIKKMSISRRGHSAMSLKKWHQREKESRRLAQEGERRVRQHNQRQRGRRFQRPAQQNQRYQQQPQQTIAVPQLSMQMSLQMGGNSMGGMQGAEKRLPSPSRQKMSSPWDQLDENEMPRNLPQMTPGGMMPAHFMQPQQVMYQPQQHEVVYQQFQYTQQYAMMPTNMPTTLNQAAHAQPMANMVQFQEQQTNSYQVDPEMYGADSRFQKQTGEAQYYEQYPQVQW